MQTVRALGGAEGGWPTGEEWVPAHLRPDSVLSGAPLHVYIDVTMQHVCAINLLLSAHATVVHVDVCNMFISRCTTGRAAAVLRPTTQGRQTSRRSLHVFARMTSIDDAFAAGPTVDRPEMGVLRRHR